MSEPLESELAGVTPESDALPQEKESFKGPRAQGNQIVNLVEPKFVDIIHSAASCLPSLLIYTQN
jgi:hypothetical protein